jgi:hypothetical protein
MPSICSCSCSQEASIRSTYSRLPPASFQLSYKTWQTNNESSRVQESQHCSYSGSGASHYKMRRSGRHLLTERPDSTSTSFYSCHLSAMDSFRPSGPVYSAKLYPAKRLGRTLPKTPCKDVWERGSYSSHPFESHRLSQARDRSARVRKGIRCPQLRLGTQEFGKHYASDKTSQSRTPQISKSY